MARSAVRLEFCVVAVSLGVLGGLASWQVVGHWNAPVAPGPLPKVPTRPAGRSQTPDKALDPGGIAYRYAVALQEGQVDEVIRMTWWMKERLARVEAETGDPKAVEAARQELARKIMDRRIEGNQIRPEGIEDQYVFAPGATVTPIGCDHGRETLEKPVEERTWFRVTYPSPARAPRDGAGKPIQSMTVGVSVSTDGYILKASVIGNLDIRRDTFSYDWEVQ